LTDAAAVKPILTLTKYEAFSLMAHRVAVSERERVDMQATFLDAFGSDEEKKRLYTESQADKDAREKQEKFDAAVADEVKRRTDSAQESAAIKAAADAQASAPVNPAPVAAP
jgi:hypothetical protein